jgi:hypothetical protein
MHKKDVWIKIRNEDPTSWQSPNEFYSIIINIILYITTTIMKLFLGV